MNTKISKKVIGAIVAAGIMSFCGVVVETAMNITFPTLMAEFHVTTATVQWMTTIYLLVVAIIVPLSAILKRRFKTKSLFVVANLLFILGVVLDAFAPSFSMLLIGRMIQGVGTGIALPLMFNIILEQVPLPKIGMMMGIGTLITAVAPAVGPTFGGVVVSTIGWRYIFIFLLPILVISLIIGLVSIQQKSELRKTSFDFISLLWIMLTFIGLIIGFSNMGNGHFLSQAVLVPIILGLIGLVLLVHRSLNIKTPIINLAVLKNGKFAGHVLSFFALQLISLGLSFILPNYIQLVNGTPASIAGLIVLPGAILGAIFAPFGGRILDTIGPKKPLMTGSMLGLLALILFVIFGLHLNNVMIGAFYLIFMACVGLSFGNIMTNGLKYLPKQVKSDGNAILTTLQQFAGATGTSLVAAIIAQGQAKVGVSKAVGTAQGSEHAFIFLLVLGLIEAASLVKVVLLAKED